MLLFIFILFLNIGGSETQYWRGFADSHHYQSTVSSLPKYRTSLPKYRIHYAKYSDIGTKVQFMIMQSTVSSLAKASYMRSKVQTYPNIKKGKTPS